MGISVANVVQPRPQQIGYRGNFFAQAKTNPILVIIYT